MSAPKPPGTSLPSTTLPRRNLDRDGALDPIGVDENFRKVERELRRIPQIQSDRPPEVELLVGQAYQTGVLVGTMTVVVHDVGDNFEGYVRFATVEGLAEFDHSDPTDTVVWNLTDSTLPYTASVDLQAKHGGLIAVAVPYRTFSEPDEIKWVIKQHRYDEDFEAELTGHELAFDTDGYPLLSLTGDEDVAKHYVRMAVGDDVAGATPGDPSAGTNDATLAARTGKLRFDGAGGVANKQAAMGKIVGYKVVCENGDGIVNAQVFGPYFQRRGDSKTIAPRIRVVGVRSSATVAIDLTIDDPALSVTAVEFRKRENGGSLSSYGTGWDRTGGTIGTNITLTRGEDVASAHGLDSQLSWRVTWTDELGTSQYVEDSINVSRLEEISGIRLTFPGHAFIPTSDAFTWNAGITMIAPGTIGVSLFGIVPLTFPQGITLTNWRMEAFRTAVGDTATATLYRVSSVGGTSSLSTITHNTTGWTTLSASISETTNDSYHYAILFELQGTVAADDARLARFAVDYTRPGYDKVY